jgi:hypothetical protein
MNTGAGEGVIIGYPPSADHYIGRHLMDFKRLSQGLLELF